MPPNYPQLDTLIVDTIGAMVVVTDREGTIIRFNLGGQRMMEYESHEVLGRLIWEVFPPPELRERMRERFGRLLVGEALQFEVVWFTKSGIRKNLSCSCVGVPGGDGKVEYTIGTGIDVTERATTEQALRNSEERFRTTFDDAAIGMALVDEKGRYLHVNHAFCRLTGYEEHELLRLDLLSITHPDDRERNKAMVESLFGREIPGYVLEKRYIRRNGETVWVQVSASIASEGQGRPSTIIGLFENISERKATQQALKKAYAELTSLNETLEQRVTTRTAELQARTEELHKSRQALLEQSRTLRLILDSLRESEGHYKELAESHLRMAREVDHRVRNNLQGLLGLLSVMRDRAADVASFADAMESRLAGMQHVHQLLAQARWKAVEMRALVDGALATLRHMACFPTEMLISGPDVFIGSRQLLPLTLVIVEWFTNSCKYGAHSRPGGRLDIRWERIGDAIPPRIRLAWTERGGPPIKMQIVPSVGTELVQGFVRRGLSGNVELRYPLQGVDHFLEFTVRDEGAMAPDSRDSARDTLESPGDLR